MSYNTNINTDFDINNIPSSKNAIDICNAMGFIDPRNRAYATIYSIGYKNIFKGINKSSRSIAILKLIGIEENPTVNDCLTNNIIFIKTKLYGFKKNRQYDNTSAEWIGILAGLMLYFDELDEINNNRTTYMRDAGYCV